MRRLATMSCASTCRAAYRNHGARLEAVFEPSRLLDGWTCQLLDTATHVAALILEIERAQGRSLASRNRPDGAAPLIGSSLAIRAVRDRIERVAATDFTVLIEGAVDAGKLWDTQRTAEEAVPRGSGTEVRSESVCDCCDRSLPLGPLLMAI